MIILHISKLMYVSLHCGSIVLQWCLLCVTTAEVFVKLCLYRKCFLKITNTLLNIYSQPWELSYIT